uniref:Uncharacterized protein n=1 Tax=Rousettus aegyptiacus TaxID=9407 RepID=A0A7J8BFH2_ROUAE|nr:hypothetical protein HJG63_009841 [Rousettus aegyptiacus]
MNYKQEKDKNTTPTTAENQRQMKKKNHGSINGGKILIIVQRLELNSQQKQGKREKGVGGLEKCNSNHSVVSNPHCWISQGKVKALPHKRQALIRGNTKSHSLGTSYDHVIARSRVWLFLRGSINPLCEYTTVRISLLLLMDIWVVSSFCPVQMALLWTFFLKLFLDVCIRFPWDVNRRNTPR